jgi:hypothetical protein
VDVSGDRQRAIFDRSRPFYMPGFRVTYYVPFRGDKDLLKCQPNPPEGSSYTFVRLLLVPTSSANALQGPSLPERALNRIDTIFFSHVPVCRPVRPLTPETLLDSL